MEIFIGSSQESIDLVREIEIWLEKQGHQPTPWYQPGLFPPGEQTFNILIGISRRVEGAIFIFNADDKIWYRSDSVSQPRDNVLIEYGLFAGALGPTKAIICRNGTPKQAVDLHGLTFIDISEPRRDRAKIEISIWARKLNSNSQDPPLLGQQAKIAELERENEQLKDELDFESDKAKAFERILTEKEIIDFTSYDLSTDGHWKLLFYYRYFNKVAEHMAWSVKSPNDLKHLLESSLSIKIARQIAWQAPGNPNKHRTDLNPQRNIALARKVLRVFRHYVEREAYRRFIDAVPKVIQSPIEKIGESAVSDLKLGSTQSIEP